MLINRFWSWLKIWRKINFGPVSLIFRLNRRVKITKGSFNNKNNNTNEKKGFAVLVGVGPGFGYSVARRLAQEGFSLVLVSRDAKRLSFLLDELRSNGTEAFSIGADVTDEQSVESLFDKINSAFGSPSLVVYSLQEFPPGNVLDITVPAFEMSWRSNCLGSFLVGRAAGRLMRPVGVGTIIFIGSTSSIIGRGGHLNLVVGKFGQRGLAQVFARELWPLGIHVAHLMIDADISESNEVTADFPQSDPDHIAQTIVMLHRQPASAWSSEIDLRPWNEKFWEHC